jgi:hypothetical protein
MQISDLVGIFEQYRNASVANPPKNVQQDCLPIQILTNAQAFSTSC